MNKIIKHIIFWIPIVGLIIGLIDYHYQTKNNVFDYYNDPLATFFNAVMHCFSILILIFIFI